MKQLGLITKFGRVFPGKEREAIDLFAETTKYFGEKLADGTLTYYEPYLYFSGNHEFDNGFFVVKGPEEKVIRFFEDQRRIDLNLKAGQICANVTTELLIVGDEVLTQVSRFADVTRGLVAVG